MKLMQRSVCLIVSCIVVSSLGTQGAWAAEPYIFPVIGSSSYSNDYDAPRAGGSHHAIDIIAKKGQSIVSAVSGVVESVNYPQPSWGYAVRIKGNDNRCYWYLHINNDTPGTDNGKGGPMKAYAADMNPGNRVVKGQLLGFVGDSGNAESTVAHLHFSVHPVDSRGRCVENQAYNPYWNLLNSVRISRPVQYPPLAREVLPFGAGHSGAVNVTFGDVTGDGVAETVVAAGRGGGSRVNVYTAKGLEVSFYAFDPTDRRGTDVAVGDVDADGKGEIVASTFTSVGPRIAIYKYTDSEMVKIREFATFQGLNGAARLGAGDVNGDGKDEIIAGPEPGGGPRVNIFDENGTVMATQYVYDPAFRGGVDVAVGDVAGDTKDEIVVAPLTGGNSQVRVLNQSLATMNQFYAYTNAYVGGVNISVGNVLSATSKSEIATVASPGYPLMYFYNASGSQLQSKYFIEKWWVGYYDVALTNGAYNVTLGVNRRAAVRY